MREDDPKRLSSQPEIWPKPSHRPATDFTRPPRTACSLEPPSNTTGRQPSSVFATRPSPSTHAARSGGAIEHCVDSLSSAAAAGTLPWPDAGAESLTDREHDVALLARRGYTANEIGERLFIGRRTVESHLQTIYSKLGVRSKRDLVRYLDDVGFC